MTMKARLKALEAVKGGRTSIKFVSVPKKGVYEALTSKAKLTKDADGKFFYEDGAPLHGDAKEENTRTIVIVRREEQNQ